MYINHLSFSTDPNGREKMLYSYYYEGDKNGHVMLKMQIVADGTVASTANFLCMLIGFE